MDLQNVRYSVGTIGDLLDDYMRHRSDLSKRTGKPATSTIQGNKLEVIQLKNAFGRMAVSELQTKHIWEYLHTYRGREAPVRANREISLLGSCYRYANNRGLATHNPCVGVQKNAEAPRDRLVSAVELESFCDFTRNKFHRSSNGKKEEKTTGVTIGDAFQLAFLTGKSVSQILSICLSHIRDDGIEFEGRKGGYATVVEWTPTMKQLVDEMLKTSTERGSSFLVCNLEGKQYSLGGFSSLWRRAMSAWLVERRKVDPSVERFHFHDLRAMSISSMKQQGRDAKELTGHKSDQVPDRVYDRRRIRKSKAVL
jgi:integrase